MGHFRKNMVSVFVNETCNMRCIYCPLHSSGAFYRAYSASRGISNPPTAIDLEFAKCGIADFFRETSSYQLRIFSNGEAMLEFDRVRAIKDYASSLAGSELVVELQTNGYFDEHVASWICDHVDILWVSLDGLPEVQRLNRPTQCGRDSFDVIDRNLKRVRKDGRAKVGLRPTISNHNIDRQAELIDYASENGIDVIYAYPWVSFLGRKSSQPDLMGFADAFLEARAYAEKLGIFYGTVFTINFDEEVEINCRALLPAPHLTTDGYVSCCDMMNRGMGLLADLIYGKYDPARRRIEYDREKIEKIRSRNIYTLERCRDCEVLKHCAGGCVGAAIMASWDLYGINPDYCRVTKYLFRHLLSSVNIGFNKDILLHP